MTPTILDDLLRIQERIAAEKATAAPLVAELATRKDLPFDKEIPRNWRTAGFASELTSSARGLLESDPQRSLALAQLALVVMTDVYGDYPPSMLAQIESAAWAQAASSHRYRAEYDAALRALDVADRIVTPFAALGFDRALMQFSRAIVHAEMNQPDLAQPLLEQAAEVFAEYGDAAKSAQCELLRGGMAQRAGNLALARSIYQQVISVAGDDLQTSASAQHNLATVLIELGDSSSAAMLLQNARTLYLELGLITESIRALWSLARLQMAGARYGEARDRFLEARRSFGEFGMVEEAGLAGLDSIEAMIAMNERDPARALASAILQEFSAAGLNRHALTALAYLRDVAANAEPGAARYVRDYVNSLRREPERLFVPPLDVL